jgi:DNA-directed RNA polymerase subunit RPC12/RpoP
MPALEERTHTRADGRLFGVGDERTLDDLVVGALYDASRGDEVACPVCGVPSFSLEGADLLECRSCGSRLEPA